MNRKLAPVIAGLALGALGLYLAATRKQAAAAPNAPSLPGLALVYYGIHDYQTDQRIFNANPDILIDNTPGGYWHGNCDSAKFQAQGIRVFSYIYADYDRFPLAQNQSFIEAIAAEGARGIFVDMVNTRATDYMTSLCAYAHSAGLEVMVNTGVFNLPDASLYDIADLVMTDEHYEGRTPSPVERLHLDRTVVIGFNSGWTAAQAAGYTRAAWANGFGYSWHEQVEYITLPVWLEEYIELL